MREVISQLSLSNSETELYLNAFGKDLLTLKELRVLIPKSEKENLKDMVKNLIDKNLFIKIESKFDEFIPRYYALPPFEAIREIFKKNNLLAVDEGQKLTYFKEDLREFQLKLKEDIQNFRNAILKSLKFIDPSEEISQILQESEENFKRLVIVLLTKVKTSIENLKEKEEITKADLETIIEGIMNTLSESDTIVSKVFDQINGLIDEIMDEVFSEEVAFNENIFDDIQTSINDRVLNTFKDLISKSSESVDIIEDSLQEVLKYYSLKNKVYIKDLWHINSHLLIKEEISRLKDNKVKNLKIIIPSIEKFLPLEKFGIDAKEDGKGDILEKEELLRTYMVDSESEIKLAAPHSFDHSEVKAIISKNPDMEYRCIEKSNTVAISADNFLIMGIFREENDTLNDFIGFGTDYLPVINLLKQSIDHLWNDASPPREVQITRGFNKIMTSINHWNGNKIGEYLEHILETAFEEKGISLELIELKLLLNTLNKKHTTLTTSLKKKVISQIQELNDKYSPLQLEIPPELDVSKIKEKEELEKEMVIPDSVEPVSEVEIEYEKISTLFDMFLDKVDSFKGKKISEQIDNFLEIVLRLQGHSSILEWRSELNEMNDTLDEPFQEKLKNDFLRWKKSMLKPKTPKPSKKGEIEAKDKEKTEPKTMEDEKEEEYISPGLSQSQFNEEEVSSEGKKEDSLAYHLNYLEDNLDTITGKDISDHLQDGMDIILETKGYSMSLKGMKNWINKFKFSNSPLNDEEKEEFIEDLMEWRETYIEKGKEVSQTNVEGNENEGENTQVLSEEEEKEEIQTESLEAKFESIIENISTLKGIQISQRLLGISDIILQKEGAMAARGMRNWISKLRTIREPLEEDMKEKLLEEAKSWKEKFSE
jgi:hypothetical protein